MIPDCGCHGLPMRWCKDTRYRAGGFWKCAEKGRAYVRARYAHDVAYRQEKLERAARNYHKPDGGYIRRRRRELAAQRGLILAQLTQLDQEATSLAQ